MRNLVIFHQHYLVLDVSVAKIIEEVKERFLVEGA